MILNLLKLPLKMATLSLVMMLGPALPAVAGTHSWTGAGGNKFWNNAVNWTGGAPTNNEAAPVVLKFPANTLATNNIVGLVVDSIIFTNTGSVLHGTGGASLIFRGAGGTNLLAVGAGFGVSNMVASTLPITLNGTTLFYIPENFDLTIQSGISGPGGVSFAGGGIVWYSGPQPNTYAGPTMVLDAGMLSLGKPFGVNAVAGPLVVGDDNSTNIESLTLAGSEQIPTSVPVTFKSRAGFYLQGFNETLGRITLHSAYIDTVGGTLTLATNVFVENSYNSAGVIKGKLSLGGADRTFNVTNSAALILAAQISDGASTAGIIKTGPGLLVMQGTNTYNGNTVVNGGILEPESPQALGSAFSGTIVASNCFLRLEKAHVSAEPLTLAGTLTCYLASSNSWAGNVTLLNGARIDTQGGQHITLSGAINGSAQLIKGGTRILVLSGNVANSYSGGTLVEAGTLLLNKSGAVAIPGPLHVGDGIGVNNSDVVRLLLPNQIADSSAVLLESFALFDLNGQTEAIGSFSGSGNLALGLGLLTCGGDNSNAVFNGVISGLNAGGFIKNGAGTFTLNGINTCSGSATVNAGKLVVNGALPGPILLKATAALGGTGTVGQVTGSLAQVGPGNSIGMLNTGNLNLTNNSSLEIELAGTTLGSGYDQLNVTGSVKLLGASLSVKLGFPGAISNQFVIIQNDGSDAVSGTFAGLAEGATLSVDGAQFQISYKGGSGSNDIVLTQLLASTMSKIGGLEKLGDGKMKISGNGNAGNLYDVEANFDLSTTNWAKIGTAQADQNGAISFIDNDAAKHQMRFYRIKLQ